MRRPPGHARPAGGGQMRRPALETPAGRRGLSRRIRALDRAEIDIAGEIEYILRRAAAGETRLVGLAPLVFLSAPGSAWLLDADDSLAYCLMDDFTPRPSPLEWETDGGYAIRWEARFEVAGAFRTISDEGQVTVHPELPAAEIARWVADTRKR